MLFLCFGILLFVSASVVSSSSVFFVSDGVFKFQAYSGRSLLQATKCCLSLITLLSILLFYFSILACPLNFESVNYTIMTDKCRGPKYPANLCCFALKDIAWPHADEINDLSNNCAATMFSYINLYGKYPPGLFANVCREGKDGLACPAESPSPSDAADENAASITAFAWSLLVLQPVFSIMLFNQL